MLASRSIGLITHADYVDLRRCSRRIPPIAIRWLPPFRPSPAQSTLSGHRDEFSPPIQWGVGGDLFQELYTLQRRRLLERRCVRGLPYLPPVRVFLGSAGSANLARAPSGQRGTPAAFRGTGSSQEGQLVRPSYPGPSRASVRSGLSEADTGVQRRFCAMGPMLQSGHVGSLHGAQRDGRNQRSCGARPNGSRRRPHSTFSTKSASRRMPTRVERADRGWRARISRGRARGRRLLPCARGATGCRSTARAARFSPGVCGNVIQGASITPAILSRGGARAGDEYRPPSISAPGAGRDRAETLAERYGGLSDAGRFRRHDGA